MELRFCDTEQWLSLADQRIACDLGPYEVTDAANHLIKITPFITACRDVVVLGGDWIPIRKGGIALLDQMVHTPIIYLGKAKNIREVEGKFVADTSAVSEYPEDVILVGGGTNYYHWLIDSLPRLLLARKHLDISRYKIIVNKPLLRFQRESLALLGIDERQLLPVGDNEVIRARTTIIPSLLASTTVPHPLLPKLLQEAFPQRIRSTCERVYLSRQDASSRRLLNEPALVSLLSRYGFERVMPSRLGFQQQIDLCYGAKALIAVHGAGMANIAFCPATTKVFELFTPRHKVTSMFMLSRTCKRQHRFVAAHNITFGKDGSALLGNWEADLNAIESALIETLG